MMTGVVMPYVVCPACNVSVSGCVKSGLTSNPLENRISTSKGSSTCHDKFRTSDCMNRLESDLGGADLNSDEHRQRSSLGSKAQNLGCRERHRNRECESDTRVYESMMKLVP